MNERMHTFESGKGKWNQFEILWDDREIVLKDNLGCVRLHEKDFDEFYRGIEKVREKVESRKFAFIDEDDEDDM